MQEKNLENAKKKAVELLKSVIEGKIPANRARELWPEVDSDEDLNAGFHLLYHFEDDEDIRLKDPRYASWQIGELEKVISKLGF